MLQTTDTTYRMLIVEDDPDVRAGLEDFFEMQGYAIDSAHDGAEALSKLDQNAADYDIVLLDVMLPKVDGFEVLRTTQENGLEAPVLLLTARGEQESVLQGFGLGADDYVTKPFSAEELAARVRAILHRTLPADRTPMEIYTIGEVEINFSTHQAVHKDGSPVNFTALEFDILQYLILNEGQTVTRKQLLTDVWRIDQDIITRTIDRHMASIRKKIEPDSAE
ncbi:MAG: response regulator transcription factor, partial [Bacteroidota bacterium]